MLNNTYATDWLSVQLFSASLASLWLGQAPPTDAGFYEAWDQLGPQAILVAVIVAASFLFWRLLKRAWDTEDRLDAENTNLTRQNEHMSLEGINAIRDFTALLRELEKEMAAVKIEAAQLRIEIVRKEP